MKKLLIINILCLYLSAFLSFNISAQNSDSPTSSLYSYNSVVNMAIDEEFLWVVTKGGLVQRRKSNGEICGIYNSSNSPLPDNGSLKYIEIDDFGRVWLATEADATVYRLDGEGWYVDDIGGNLTGFKVTPSGNPVYAKYYYIIPDGYGGNVRLYEGACGIQQDANGAVWISYCKSYGAGSPGGGIGSVTYKYRLVKFDAYGWGTTEMINNEIEELSYGGFSGFYARPDGKVILYRPDGGGWALVDFETGITEELEEKPIVGTPDVNGFFWRKDGQGVYRYTIEGEEEKFYFSNEGLLNTYSLERSLFVDKKTGEVFLGNSFSGLSKLDAANNRWTTWIEELISSDIDHIFSDKNNEKWFVSHSGISQFDGLNFTSYHALNSSIPKGRTNFHHVTPLNQIWLYYETVEADGKPLQYFDGMEWTGFNEENLGQPLDRVEQIYSDSIGNSWLVYKSEGEEKLSRFDGTEWAHFDTFDSLYVSSAYPDLHWSITDSAAVKREGLNTAIYSFPSEVFDLDCNNVIRYKHISETGIGWIITCVSGDDLFSWRVYRFEGAEWQRVGGHFHWGRLMGIYPIKDKLCVFSGSALYEFGGQSSIYVFDEETGDNASSKHLQHGCDESSYRYATWAGPNNMLLDDENNLWIEYSVSRATNTTSVPTPQHCTTTHLMKIDASNKVSYYPTSDFPKENYENTLLEEGNIFWASTNSKIVTNQLLQPQLQLYAKPADCNDGSVLACVLGGGIAPFSYEWSNGVSSPINRGIGAGIHEVTMYDGLEEIYEESIEVEGNPLFTVELEVETDGLTGLSNISFQFEGGTPLYLPEWSTGHIGTSLEGVEPGEYSLTLTDGNGCKITDSVMIEGGFTNIDENFLTSIKLYPNPTKGELRIQLGGKPQALQKIEILDVTSRILEEIEGGELQFYNETLFLNLEEYETGVYFLQFQIDEMKTTKKVFVF